MVENFGVKHAQARAVQGWVNLWQEGCRGEKNSRVKDAQSWAVQGCVLLGEKKTVLAPADH